MNFLRSTGVGSEWNAFLWRNTEKNDSQSQSQPVSAEAAAARLGDLDQKIVDSATRVERQAQRKFEHAFKQLQRQLDRNKVDASELAEIAVVFGAGVATPDQKSTAELALQKIPVEDILKWGGRGSRAETLKNIFVTGWRVDLRGVSITAAQEMKLYQLLGEKTPQSDRTDRKQERITKRAGTPAEKFQKWIEEGMSVVEIIAQPDWKNIPASIFRAQSPETLRMLFAVDGVVNFHGNKNASRYIGAGNLFGPEQEWVEIAGKLGRRSIDSKFNSNQIGYVDEQGNYFKIFGKGAELIRAVDEPSDDRKKDFAETLIVGGEESYRKKFDTFLANRERAAAKRAPRNVAREVENNTELLTRGEVDLDRVANGREQLNSTIDKILAHRADYLAVETATGVPWKLIAAIHYRESANNFDTYLHNGQQLGKVTTLHPAGILFEKGQWREAAIDAISRIKKGNNFGHISPDASFGEMLEFAERYNGMGYDNRGMESPYVWSGTTNYERGKYVADGKFDPTKVDKQLGVAPIMAALDVAGGGYELLAADELTFAEARLILTSDRFNLSSSSGGFTDRTNKKHTTLDGLKRKTALGAVNLLDDLSLAQVTTTGGTETGHAGGLSGRPGTHGDGSKLDFDDDLMTNRAFENYFAENDVNGVTTGDGMLYDFESNGFRYEVLREGDHWDILVA